MRRWLICGCIIAMIVPFIAFSVSAADSNNNEFVNINDYASYDVGDDNRVQADIQFPGEWISSYLYTGFSGHHFGEFVEKKLGSNFTVTGYADYMSIRTFPQTGLIQVGPYWGLQLQNTHIVDLSYIPKKSVISYNFSVAVENPLVDVEWCFDEHLIFVDSNGKIVEHNNYSFSPIYHPQITEDISTGEKYTWNRTIDLATSVPTGAKGLVVYFDIRSIRVDNGPITCSFDGLKISFDMNELEYETMQNEQIKATLSNIQSALEEQGKQIDELPDKIGDEMQQVADNEKEEANSSGNGSVDQMIQIIPDYSTGLIEGVKNLAAAISYEGTECKLTMPALTIPALKGVTTKSITFMDEQEVDLEVWFNRMPEKIMAVTRAMFDIAVVGFCFYELYDLVSQLANGARKAEKVSK